MKRQNGTRWAILAAGDGESRLPNQEQTGTNRGKLQGESFSNSKAGWNPKWFPEKICLLVPQPRWMFVDAVGTFETSMVSMKRSPCNVKRSLACMKSSPASSDSRSPTSSSSSLRFQSNFATDLRWKNANIQHKTISTDWMCHLIYHIVHLKKGNTHTK